MEFIVERVNAGSWLLLGLISLLTWFYWYLTSQFGYWEKQNVPVSKPWPLFGTASFRKLFFEADMEQYKKHGRFYGEYKGREPGLMIAEPDLIRQVTVKDFWKFPDPVGIPILKDDNIGPAFLINLKGEKWKQVRTLLSPTFTTGKLKQMTYLIEECCSSLVNLLDGYAKSGQPFDAKRCMSAFAMDVIANCAFGTKIDATQDLNNEFVREARNAIVPKYGRWKFFVVIFLPKLVPYIPSFILAEFRFGYFARILKEMIEMKKQNKHARRDFLDLLLEAKIDDNDGETKNESTQSVKKILTPDLITAQSILFLLAGHDTTSTTLSLTLYYLALNPHVQDKLAKEVDGVMKEHKDKIDYEIINELPYAEMVISETLRLWPPAPRTTRTCVEDGYKLNGATLKKGMTVSIPIFCIHHDPEYYPDPDKYDPERFSQRNKSKRDPMTYLPFGAGPRNCIGMRFAMMELKMALATIVRHFRVNSCSQTEAMPEFEGIGLLQPKKLTLSVERRIH